MRFTFVNLAETRLACNRIEWQGYVRVIVMSLTQGMNPYYSEGSSRCFELQGEFFGVCYGFSLKGVMCVAIGGAFLSICIIFLTISFSYIMLRIQLASNSKKRS